MTLGKCRIKAMREGTFVFSEIQINPRVGLSSQRVIMSLVEAMLFEALGNSRPQSRHLVAVTPACVDCWWGERLARRLLKITFLIFIPTS